MPSKFLRNATLALAACSLGFGVAGASDLVILHTNDTHSLIDPDDHGAGGVLQRKAIIDSVRAAEKNVLLVDAGDVVQGTLYFKFFRGDVEYPLMNMAGYDVMILGNHEFDNGMQEMADHYKTLKADRLSANYDFNGTPMQGLMKPWTIKKVDGKKIGFIGLNIDPASLISAQNYAGMGFTDPIEVANKTAAMLKKEKGCDLVVAVTHIGAIKENEKPTDYELAAASRDIDIIIGGHSHTVIRPDNSTPDCPATALNADGRPVIVAQTGRYGKYLGYIKIDLDSLASQTPADYDRQLIPVTDRFPADKLDRRMADFIRPFREKIDSVNNRVIGRADYTMDSNARTGAYPNWSADFAKWYGSLKADSLRAIDPQFPAVDFGMMNVGGIRHDMPAGNVTEGQILSTFPFANRMVLVKIKGSDFADAMKVAAAKGGEAISDEVRVLTDGKGGLVNVLINGAPIDPDRTYTFSTIDYIAAGNDDLLPLAKGEIIYVDEPEMSAPMMRYVVSRSALGLPLNGDPRSRFVEAVVIPEGK